MLSESQYVWRRDRSSGNHDNDFVVGIDFGTTNSCVAIWNPYKKRAKVIKNFNGTRLTRSTIKFDDDFDHPIVGVTEITELYSTHVISRIKLLLGSADQTQVQCNNAKGDACDISVDKLCSFILDYVRQYTEAYIAKNLKKLQQPLVSSSSSSSKNKSKASPMAVSNRQLPLKAAVIGIPVSFGTLQVNALRKAALMAGFEKVYFMSESTAAAMSYGLLVAGTKTVVIFDMGGGTTDVTVLQIEEGHSKVLATAGNGQCGGSNFDSCILRHVLEKIVSEKLQINKLSNIDGDDNSNINIANKLYGMLQSNNNNNNNNNNSYAVLCGHLLAICSKAKESLTDVDEVSLVVSVEMMKQIRSVLVSIATVTTTDNVGVTSSTVVEKDIRGENNVEHDVDVFEMILSRDLFNQLCAPVVASAALVLQTAIHTMRQSLHNRHSQLDHHDKLSSHRSHHHHNDEDGDHGDDDDTATATSDFDLETLQQSHSRQLENGVKEEDDIDEVVLVGGSSRVVSVQQAVMAVLQKENITVFNVIKPSSSSSTGEATSSTTTNILGTEADNTDIPQQQQQQDQDQSQRELCTSIDPDLAVVQGLAIRGAVLMGYDAGVMKDILMLDILPNSIGIMSWVVPSECYDSDDDRSGIISDNETDDEGKKRKQNNERRQFEPILLKGSRIPATGVKTFMVENDTAASSTKSLLSSNWWWGWNSSNNSRRQQQQRKMKVSLDIYEEEILEQSGDEKEEEDSDNKNDDTTITLQQSSSVQHRDNITNITSDDKKKNKTKYHLMGTYDIPIPPLPKNNSSNDNDLVSVHFHLDIHGALTFSVTRSQTQQQQQCVHTAAANDSNGDANKTLNSGNPGDNSAFAAIVLKAANTDNGDGDTWMMNLLIGYCVLMFIIYIFVKLYLADLSNILTSSLPSFDSSPL